MLSWGAQRGIDLVIAKELVRQASNELAKVTAKNKARLEEQKRINAKRAEEQRTINEQYQLEEMKRQAGYKQAMETCTFWQNQYKKEPTSYNKLQRSESCYFGTRHKKSSNRINSNCLIQTKYLARPARFERATAWFVV